MTDLSVGAALDRLSVWLERPEASEIRASLRDPASAADIDGLRRLVAPCEVPSELVSVLRWHDGQHGHQEDTPSLLPISQGTLKGTPDVPDSYKFLTEKCEAFQWCPLWVPIQQMRWSQTGVVSVGDGKSVVVDAGFGEDSHTIVSSSLAALLHAVADMGEDGMLVQDVPYREQQRLLQTRSDEYGWGHWAWDRVMPNDLEAINWPPEWRAARGFE